MVGNCNVVEVRHELLKPLSKLFSNHGRTVTGGGDGWLQCGQRLNRATGSEPIRGEVSRRTMNLLLLSGDIVERFLLNGDKRIAGDKQPVTIAEERDMPLRMTRRVNPAPFRHERRPTVHRQRLYTRAKVNGPLRISKG